MPPGREIATGRELWGYDAPRAELAATRPILRASNAQAQHFATFRKWWSAVANEVAICAKNYLSGAVHR